MIRTSPTAYYRAAATVVAAAVLSFTTRHASAQAPIDLFAGTGTPTTLSVTDGLSGTNSNQGAFGPGFTGTVSLSAGALNTLSEGFTTAGSSNTFTIGQTGAATVAGTTSASKTYNGLSLTAGDYYQLTLALNSGFAVGVLGHLNVSLADGSTTVLDTASGTGLADTVDLVSLFGGGNTATLTFMVPAGATGNLGFTIGSTETAGLLGGSYTFNSATITQVPEPRTVATMLLGVSGLALLRIRRRLRML